MANNQIAALARRGMARCGANQFDAAIADFTTVIGASPGIAAAWYNRGYAWYRKGNKARAIADWERAAALAPHNALYRKALKQTRAAGSAKRAVTPDTRPGYAPAREPQKAAYSAPVNGETNTDYRQTFETVTAQYKRRITDTLAGGPFAVDRIIGKGEKCTRCYRLDHCACLYGHRPWLIEQKRA